MTGNADACNGCGKPLDPVPAGKARPHCPACGATARRIAVEIEETIHFSDSLRVKGSEPKPSGGKREFLDAFEGTEHSRALGRVVKKSRLVDRRANRYMERVVDPQSGDVLRDVDEPLTDHRGRGSAKKTQGGNDAPPR